MSIQDHEIDAWLDEAAGELTGEQRERFARLVRAYDASTAGRPGERADYTDEDTAAWVAALEAVEGSLDVARRGREYRDAQTAAYMGAVVAVLDGMSEVQAAEAARISRPTLRRALGK